MKNGNGSSLNHALQNSQYVFKCVCKTNFLCIFTMCWSLEVSGNTIPWSLTSGSPSFKFSVTYLVEEQGQRETEIVLKVTLNNNNLKLVV